MYGKHHTEETKKKMSLAQKGKTTWNKGLKEDKCLIEKRRLKIIKTKHDKSKISWVIVDEIRRQYKCGDISQRTLAKEFNLHQGTIWAIVNNNIWRV